MTETNVIVGAGQAGGWAAMAMRDAGFTGRILLIGEEPWQPYERPPLSKAMLVAAEEPPVVFFHDRGRYEDQSIELKLNQAVAAIDPQNRNVELRDGGSIGYDRLLLTTGGRARPLPIPGGEHVVLLRSLEDSRHLRHLLGNAGHVVCIGAGVIGLEVASSARKRGCEVTVLEATARPLGRAMSAEAAGFVQRLHERAGTKIRTSVAVEAIEKSSTGGYHVICAGDEVIRADLVIAGIGMQRNVDLAAQAGLETDNGILVDEFGRTSAADIFAAGDATAFFHPFYARRIRLETWRHAQNHGIAVGKTMAGQETPYDDIPWFWTDQHGVNIQIAGLPQDSVNTIVRVDEAERFLSVHMAADNSLVSVTAAGSPRDIRAGTALIRSRRALDPLLLADASVPLQQVLRG